MLFSYAATISLLATLAAAVDHPVQVSPGGQFTYSPSSVNASIGDTITVTFPAGLAHSLTQTSTQSPCIPLAGGTDTGLVSSTTKTLTITSTDPLYFSCQQVGHCGFGMVFTINTPDSGPGSWTDFQQAAIHGTSAGTAPAAGGSSSTTASSTASATGTASATPAIHTVTVGGGGNLKYTPNIVQANPKDIVVFTFESANHTASQSTFAEPCVLKAGGFDSGFNFNTTTDTPNPPLTFNITVNDTAPVWVYCKQRNPKDHCGAGMVMAINSNETSPQNFSAFQALAIAINGTNSTNSTNSTTGAPPAKTGTGSVVRGVAAFVPTLAFVGIAMFMFF